MPHPLVTQLRFARSEFVRCIHGVSLTESYIRHGQMNCISWIIGHLASQENQYFVFLAQGKAIQPDLRKIAGSGSRPSAPRLDDMWSAWREVTANADVYLDTVTPETLQTHFEFRGEQMGESVGTMIQRTLYHYWFHIGEVHAIRQMLGHRNMPQFVGNMSNATYMPE